MRIPIAIMSFNRPEFLDSVLSSLRAQRGGDLADREIHLFQDGAVNRYSKIIYAKEDDLQACLTLFRRYFPDGEIHYSGQNLGICENFYRAENYLFQERQFDSAYFFEDDLVLSPVYLEMMDRLHRYAEQSTSIAYFAAYGDHYAQPEEVAERRRELVTLDHHWGFGLLRPHWKQIREELAGYYKLVLGQDYARRDHRAIYDYFAASGACPRGSSQDAAKAFACDRLGLWRCRTFVPFARYIGTKGAHMTPEAYETIGFSKTVMADDVIADLDFPDDSRIGILLAEQHALFVEIHRNELGDILRSLPARELNPMRRCTPEDVRAAYRLLLHREPESQAVIDRHVRESAVYSMIRGLTRSKEFTELQTGIEHPW